MPTIEQNERIDEATVVAVEDISLKELLASENTLMGKAMAVLTWFNSTRIGRARARMGMAAGRYLAGGIAYAALFSIGAALTIGFTIFMAVLGGNEELRGSVIDSVNAALPGMISDGSNDGMVNPDDLVMDTAWNFASISALVVLLWSALAVMTALRTSIQRIFGVVGTPAGFVMGKVKDFAGFLILAVAVLATSVLGIAASALGTVVLEWLGITGSFAGFLIRAATLLAAALVDFGVFVFLFRVVAGMRIPKRDLVTGAAMAAVASGALRILGTSVVKSASSDPVMAAGAAVVTLLLWVNLLVRITLLVAAWISNPPAPKMPQSPEELRNDQSPNYVTLSAPESLEWDYQAITGELNPDPSLNPDAPEEESDPEPYWGGAIGAMKRRRIERLERKLADARSDYYR